MTPQERRLVDDLFARLSELERAPREPDAAAAINEGLQRAPNAIYALVQTVLLQEEALKRAHERLQEYEGGEPQQPEQRGFLDSMRDQFFGGGAPQRGSVPSVGRGGAWNAPQGGMQQPMAAQQQGGFAGGGSFLGTAAAAAAGVIGGSMLMNSISSMMGGGKAFASESGGGNEKSSPWSDSSNNELSKDAGASDVGNNNRQGLFDEHNNDNDGGDDFDGDMGSGDGDF